MEPASSRHEAHFLCILGSNLEEQRVIAVVLNKLQQTADKGYFSVWVEVLAKIYRIKVECYGLLQRPYTYTLF